jgi:hypothetical protein
MDPISKPHNGNVSPLPNADLGITMPCHFPQLETKPSGEKNIVSCELEIEQTQELKSLLAVDSAGTPFLLQTLWALVLRCYTSQNDVAFLYEETLDSAQIVGLPFVHVVLDEGACLSETIKQVRAKYMANLQSNIFLAPTKRLCNTRLCIARFPDSSLEELINPVFDEGVRPYIACYIQP